MTNPGGMVLFDLGNVLVRIRPEAFGARLGLGEEAVRTRYAERVRSLVRQYEEGSLSTDQYLDGLHTLLEGRHARASIREAMLAVIAEPVEGMEPLVEQVASVVPVGLVSNTNELHFMKSLDAVPALRFIGNYYLSYDLKALKPDAPYYDAVLGRIGIPPAGIVFIDDLQENVDGARRAGMTGITFDGAESLRRRLEPILQTSL